VQETLDSFVPTAPEGGAGVAVSAAGAEHLRQHRRTLADREN
jgi:hypothetical protein